MTKSKSSQPASRPNKEKRTWAINRFALITAAFTFVLIVMGALVTNNDAGSSVPDWPLSFGTFVPTNHLSGGVVYEYSHRVVAGITSVLTIGLFLWILLGERRGWVKWVGALALFLLLIQAGLGALRVRLGETNGTGIAMVHAFVAQFFLGVVVSLTVFTSPGWVRAGELRSGFKKAPTPTVFFISTAATAALLIQVMLGAAYRHGLVGIVPHITGAVVAGTLIFWASILVVGLEHDRDRAFPYLTRPARAGVWILMFQLALGVIAYLLGSGYTHIPNESERAIVAGVVHTGFSAALLATEVMLLIRLYRMVPITESQS